MIDFPFRPLSLPFCILLPSQPPFPLLKDAPPGKYHDSVYALLMTIIEYSVYSSHTLLYRCKGAFIIEIKFERFSVANWCAYGLYFSSRYGLLGIC